MAIRIEGAIIGVGLLILQRIPRHLQVPESALEQYYPEALEEFQADVKEKLGHEFEPPNGFRTATLDHLRWHLEKKGLLQ